MYKLFEEMPSPKFDLANEHCLPPALPPRLHISPPPFMVGGPEAGSVTSDYEFYPVDPISRCVNSYDLTTPTLNVRGMLKNYNQHNTWLQYHPRPHNLSFSDPRMEDGDYDISLVSR